jgi:hypothetical protein
MSQAVEIRFRVGSQVTPWEPEAVRHRGMGQIPTAVRRVSELRTRYPWEAIAIERRGVETRPRTNVLHRFQVFVKDGSMLVNDPAGINGVKMTRLENDTLLSRPFQESEREAVRSEIMQMFPKAELVEVSA